MKIAIIGGGAAGLLASCLLAKSGYKITLIEKQNRVGRKLLATGNGRCNLTNANAAGDRYISFTGDTRALLSGVSVKDVTDCFERIGVPCFFDEQGRAYPLANAASGVLDALRLYCDENGVETVTEFETVKIIPSNGFKIVSKDGKTVVCEKVIYCAGGMASPKNGGCDASKPLIELGYSFTKRLPAIASLITDTKYIKGLKGLRSKARVALYDGDKLISEEDGEVLFNDTGVSGICVMDLSLRVHGLKSPIMSIDLSSGVKLQSLISRREIMPKRETGQLLSGIVVRPISNSIVNRAIGKTDKKIGELTDAEIKRIYNCLADFRLDIKGVSGFENAQVTLGGLDMRRVDSDTLASKKHKDLYFAGEICDMTGECGGYNLHWAWTGAIKISRAIIGGKK